MLHSFVYNKRSSSVHIILMRVSNKLSKVYFSSFAINSCLLLYFMHCFNFISILQTLFGVYMHGKIRENIFFNFCFVTISIRRKFIFWYIVELSRDQQRIFCCRFLREILRNPPENV